MIIDTIEIDFKPEFGNTRHIRAMEQIAEHATKLEHLRDRQKRDPSNWRLKSQIKVAQEEIINIVNKIKK